MNMKHPLIALSLVIATATQAKTIYVTDSSGHHGMGTFSYAMQEASANDIIEFKGFATPPRVTVDATFTVYNNLTIKGHGATLTSTRYNYFFTIEDGAEVTFEDLVFDNMRQGVISAKTNLLNITRCRFTNNKAGDNFNKDNVNGTAIFITPYDASRDSVLNIKDSQFIGNELNSKVNGGAIYVNQGTRLNVSNSLFEGNRTNVNASRGGGGAISIKRRPISGIHSIVNSTFSGNQADTGGAIYSYESDVNIVNSTFFNNRANREGSAVNGDGNGTGTAYTHNISRSTFLNNHSLRNTTTNDAIFIDNNTLNLSNSIVLGREGHTLCGTYDSISGEVITRNSVLSDSSCVAVTPENNKVLPFLTPFSSVIEQSLADNGCHQTAGPTGHEACVPTLNIVANSPAINIGTASNLTTPEDYDQRGEGFNRINDSSEDAGAIESPASNTTPPQNYSITASFSPADGGTFSCNKPFATTSDTVTCTATPDTANGYTSVSFDNANCVVDANNANVCIFSNLSADQTIKATFAKPQSAPFGTVFDDSFD